MYYQGFEPTFQTIITKLRMDNVYSPAWGGALDKVVYFLGN